jgi:hypothetical protein
MPATWKLLYGSATGTSHQRRGETCQDYAHGQVIHVGESSVVILVCADGAGSAAQAALGAKLVCLTLLQAISVSLGGGLRVPDIAASHVLAWHEQARRRLSMEACLANRDLRDFASTVLTAVVSDEGAVFSQLGDGAIVIRGDSGYETVFWPQAGEYANTTFFLTEAEFEKQLVFRSLGCTVDELALLTDGLQSLALHYATRSVHAPFFEPMFQSLRKALDPEQLDGPLRQFLQSDPVNDRTDDDKTLVLATRRSCADENPEPR